MRTIIFAAMILAAGATGLSAQVIYQPVQYQFSDGHACFYYGGQNPSVIVRGYNNLRLGQDQSHIGGGGNFYPLPSAVYSDQMPMWNAALYGYTPEDAHNDANAAVPTYFRKIDILRAAGVARP